MIERMEFYSNIALFALMVETLVRAVRQDGGRRPPNWSGLLIAPLRFQHVSMRGADRLGEFASQNNDYRK
jgi:hypothetical protein